MGGVAPPDIYTEARTAQEANIRASMDVILEHWDNFGKAFGRYYRPIETHRAEGARTLLLTMGSTGETAKATVNKMRSEGHSVGQLSIRLWRPFPFQAFREAVREAEVLVVVDRAVSYGGPGGPYCSEVRNALYHQEHRPAVAGFVAGLGGRDITVAEFEAMVKRGEEQAVKGMDQEFEIFGVRE